MAAPDPIAALLGRSPEAAPLPSLDAWRARHDDATRGAARPIDEAILGGFAADVPGFAFASGYRAAVRALAGGLAGPGLVTLSVTERGGAHPRAIEATLRPVDGGLELRGEKRWATLAPAADALLVVAREGEADDGRPRLAVVRVDARAPGVVIAPMPATPFAPEIPHAEVRLDGVRVAADARLPGDGWDAWVKPFRTVEDVHVHAAIAAWIVRVARRAGLPRDVVAELVAVVALARDLASRPPSDPATHVALGGAIALARRAIDAFEAESSRLDEATRSIWARDRALLAIAERARASRLARAFDRLGVG